MNPFLLCASVLLSMSLVIHGGPIQLDESAESEFSDPPTSLISESAISAALDATSGRLLRGLWRLRAFITGSKGEETEVEGRVEEEVILTRFLWALGATIVICGLIAAGLSFYSLACTAEARGGTTADNDGEPPGQNTYHQIRERLSGLAVDAYDWILERLSRISTGPNPPTSNTVAEPRPPSPSKDGPLDVNRSAYPSASDTLLSIPGGPMNSSAAERAQAPVDGQRRCKWVTISESMM